MSAIRSCDNDDVATILTIVNSAAQAYRGVIPPDRWHEPYMSAAELHQEISGGVSFVGYEIDGELVGVMGIQGVRDVHLIRHAYVRPDRQRHGVGASLINHLLQQGSRQMLVGTWAAASWAIAFYQHHGFVLCSRERTVNLLRTYWTIPDRQAETSVVLANPPLDE
jgi:GNAT superfamily N-acetyltransferase